MRERRMARHERASEVSESNGRGDRTWLADVYALAWLVHGSPRSPRASMIDFAVYAQARAYHPLFQSEPSRFAGRT
ncbi:MAG: hypothetical protein ABIH35_00755 [Patescibacteria group bacterium]